MNDTNTDDDKKPITAPPADADAKQEPASVPSTDDANKPPLFRFDSGPGFDRGRLH
ncbi:MAG TPA: hypothetical protein VGG74_24615 [Kofleriaceae bacterium]|jgi:hypothetical protein